ncbi:hypothetical protein [Mitsuokella sp. AF21-1AC]|nr:hypothetical protein [Mitsuokella sp. AF21-1AC]
MENQDNMLHFNLQRFADTGESGGQGGQEPPVKADANDANNR